MKILCSYCMQAFEESELIYDGGKKTDYCPHCGEAYYAKANEKRIRQTVLQAAYNKLYYDFRHEPIKSRLNDGIFFNSKEQPCGENEVSETEDAGGGININISVGAKSEQQSQLELEISICYDDANGVGQLVFKDNFLPENNFFAVMDKIRPELYKLTGDFGFLGFSLSSDDAETINAYFSLEKKRYEGKLHLTGFFPDAASRIARRLGLMQYGTGHGIYYTNEQKRIIFTYTEGDLSIKIFNDAELYQNEVMATEKFYKET